MKIITAIIITAIAVSAVFLSLPKNAAGDLARPTVVADIQPGCVLVSPFPQLLQHNFIADVRPRVFLINKKTKKIVRQWSGAFPFFIAKIDPAGGLWGLTHKRWDGGVPAEIIRINDKSESTVRVNLPNLEGDFDLHPGGETLFVIQSYQSKSAQTGKPFIYDKILEVDLKTLQTVWSWDTKELNASEKDLNSQQREDNEIMHTNSVRYVSSNPFNQKPALLVSARNISQLVLVDYETKAILWTSRNWMLQFQHDARLLENGDVLVFNNRRFQSASSIDQINPKTDALVWQYRSATEQDFHQAVLGGAQRLENGNTLITGGLRGHIFEINSKKQVVWEYFSQFETSGRESSWPISPVVRAEHYSPEYIEKIGWGKICE